MKKLFLYTVAALMCFMLVIVLASIGIRPQPREQTQTLDVRVGWNDDEVQVTNVSAPSGSELIVYINGTPPFTYRSVALVPTSGDSIRLPLAGFVKKDGQRFNPAAQAVTVAWVGGGGYDYRQFKP